MDFLHFHQGFDWHCTNSIYNIMKLLKGVYQKQSTILKFRSHSTLYLLNCIVLFTVHIRKKPSEGLLSIHVHDSCHGKISLLFILHFNLRTTYLLIFTLVCMFITYMTYIPTMCILPCMKPLLLLFVTYGAFSRDDKDSNNESGWGKQAEIR